MTLAVLTPFINESRGVPVCITTNGSLTIVQLCTVAVHQVMDRSVSELNFRAIVDGLGEVRSRSSLLSTC